MEGSEGKEGRDMMRGGGVEERWEGGMKGSGGTGGRANCCPDR